MTGANVEYRLGGPEVLYAGGALEGQLKLKWAQASVVPQLSEQNIP